MNRPNDWKNYEQEFQYYVTLYKEEHEMSDAFKAISAGKATIDSLKLLAQYGDEIKDVRKYGEFMRIIGETNLQLAETQNKLAEQIRQNSNLQEEIVQLKKEIENLKSGDAEPVFQNGLYYLNYQGPYCTNCYDDKRKRIRVVELPQAIQHLEVGKYKCPACKTTYMEKSY